MQLGFERLGVSLAVIHHLNACAAAFPKLRRVLLRDGSTAIVLSTHHKQAGELQVQVRSLREGKAIVPSTKKVGGVGARLDIPMTHIQASFVRSHYDSMEIGLADAPRSDELLLALVMSTGPRIHARVGGLDASEIIGEDGLR